MDVPLLTAYLINKGKEPNLLNAPLKYSNRRRDHWFITFESSNRIIKGELPEILSKLEGEEVSDLSLKLVLKSDSSAAKLGKLSKEQFEEKIWGGELPIDIEDNKFLDIKSSCIGKNCTLTFTILETFNVYTFETIVEVIRHLLDVEFYVPSEEVSKKIRFYGKDVALDELVSGCQFENLLPPSLHLKDYPCEYDMITSEELSDGYLRLRCKQDIYCLNISTLQSIFETTPLGKVPANPFTRELFSKEAVKYVLSHARRYDVIIRYDEVVEDFVTDLFKGDTEAARYYDTIAAIYTNSLAFTEKRDELITLVRNKVYDDFVNAERKGEIGYKVIRDKIGKYQEMIVNGTDELYQELMKLNSKELPDDNTYLELLASQAQLKGHVNVARYLMKIIMQRDPAYFS